MQGLRRIVCAAALTAMALGTLGCQGALFPENEPRTQYERYDRLRGRYTPTERRNAFGQVEPALRDRLSPYEQ